MTVNIDIVSDVVCPWCFIGRRRLGTALSMLGGDHQMHITWRPFELNPAIAQAGVDHKQYLEMKFGGPERVKVIHERLRHAGAGEEIAFDFDRIPRQPNTRDAHRLLWYARGEGVQDALSLSLFSAYFVEGRDIGERATLASIAAMHGLNQSAVEAFLAGQEGVAEVREEEWIAQKLGIDAVPDFIINGRYALPGAQPPEVIADALRRVIRDTEEPCQLFAP